MLPIGSLGRGIRRPALAVVIGLALLLLAVSYVELRPKPVSLAVLEANCTRQSADTLLTLRKNWNAGRCDLIYDEASVVFRRIEPRDEWLAACDDARRRLGNWPADDSISINTGPGFVAHVNGRGRFDRGRSGFSTGWIVEGGHPKLFRFCLEGYIAVPRPVAPARPLQDPSLPSDKHGC
jgi:hypothetical protein